MTPVVNTAIALNMYIYIMLLNVHRLHILIIAGLLSLHYGVSYICFIFVLAFDKLMNYDCCLCTLTYSEHTKNFLHPFNSVDS